jgi:AAA15 family ATPase/GTPase
METANKRVKHRIYLIYADDDIDDVKAVYDKLSSNGFSPWMQHLDAKPGDKLSSVRNSSSIILVLMSKKSGNNSSFKSELKKLFDHATYDRIKKTILAQLESCKVPISLRNVKIRYNLTLYGLFNPQGWDLLIDKLNEQFPFESEPKYEQILPPDDLIKECKEGNCVLFAGSGLSARAGFPTWKTFVRDLLIWATRLGLYDDPSTKSLIEAIDLGDTNFVADSIVNNLVESGKQSEMNDYLRKVFIEPNPDLPDTHQILKSIPFIAILTSNYDQLLERTFTDVSPTIYTPQDSENLLDDLAKKKFFILKLYGSLDILDSKSVKSFIITPAQYKQDIMTTNYRFAEFIKSVFISRTILFVGVSLEGILDYLEGIGIRASNRKHFALVAVTGDAWKAKADLIQRRYNIQIMSFPENENYSQVPEFLNNLPHGRIHRIDTRDTIGVTDQIEIEKRVIKTELAGLQLENIGPFPNLELKLDKQWNVLLGDNGVGKSSILKAIAFGICGEDAQKYSGRLIKFGESYGNINLMTSQNQYETQLKQVRPETIEVKTYPSSVRPLEVEGMLVLGFPPLRSISWQSVRGPLVEKEIRRPNSNDLLPILDNNPDPRINNLKQWIINLDYQISKGNELEKRLLKDFFYVISRLVGIVRLDFGEVDPKTRQIEIITNDGNVPIEFISQGTQSLIGWVGVLLQRLYEVYSDSKQPREQYALVLIDEIDAHMHPYWQQSIVPTLSELFPNVQFIATTHSPLIVAELKKEQVFLLSRDYDVDSKIKPIKVRNPDEDFTNYRADQILTSLFELTRSRGSKAIKDTDRYIILLGKQERTEEEENEFKELQEKLKNTFTSKDSPFERQVEQAVQETLAKMELKPPERKDSTKQELSPELSEIKKQLKELLEK